MSDYAGKTVFVTGVGSGMGLQSAKRLAAAGAHIVGFDRSGAEATRAAIEAERASTAQRVRLFVADISDRAATRAAIDAAVGACGKPEVLIHMAGVGGVAEMIDMPFETFDRIVQINLYGTRHIVEAVLPHMLGRVGGMRPKIVLAGSLGGFVPVYGYTAYGTSKFAVVGFARCLRYELAPRGIDVACFCPGEVATPGLAAERGDTHPATLALKRIGGTMRLEAAVDGMLAGLRDDRFLIVPGVRSRLVHLALRLTPERLWNAITDALIRQGLQRSTRSR